MREGLESLSWPRLPTDPAVFRLRVGRGAARMETGSSTAKAAARLRRRRRLRGKC